MSFTKNSSADAGTVSLQNIQLKKSPMLFRALQLGGARSVHDLDKVIVHSPLYTFMKIYQFLQCKATYDFKSGSFIKNQYP